jgi:plasmid stabilization system protein ParE
MTFGILLKKKIDVYWTTEALSQVNKIISHLDEKWGDREAKEFLVLLRHFERVISSFPKSFKESEKFESCRLGFIHRHISAIYKFNGTSIVVLTIIDNRSGFEK